RRLDHAKPRVIICFPELTDLRPPTLAWLDILLLPKLVNKRVTFVGDGTIVVLESPAILENPLRVDGAEEIVDQLACFQLNGEAVQEFFHLNCCESSIVLNKPDNKLDDVTRSFGVKCGGLFYFAPSSINCSDNPVLEDTNIEVRYILYTSDIKV